MVQEVQAALVARADREDRAAMIANPGARAMELRVRMAMRAKEGHQALRGRQVRTVRSD